MFLCCLCVKLIYLNLFTLICSSQLSHHDAALMLTIDVLSHIMMLLWCWEFLLFLCVSFLLICSSHHDAALMLKIDDLSHIMMLLWCWEFSLFFCVSHIMKRLWWWECSAVPLGQLCSDVVYVFLFVLHIMMQLWCWKLMIYLTSWCCSDVGNFHCFFVFLMSWSISDDGNVLLCPWASSAVLLCLIDFLSKKALLC